MVKEILFIIGNLKMSSTILSIVANVLQIADVGVLEHKFINLKNT